MNILIVFGTRPEYLKIEPLVNELKKKNLPFKTLFTGQHIDLVNKTSFDVDVRLFSVDYRDEHNRLTSLLGHLIYNIGNFLINNPEITHVLVQGDTTSALAGALAAMNSKVKVIHLEAGLRTYDFENPYPEEYNRQLISKIADIHLCGTFENMINLRNEYIGGDIHIVGNTILDSLVSYLPDVENTNKILVTLHRRENHDKIDKWFNQINILAKMFADYEFILPLHPNPNVQKHKNILTHVNVIEPLDHDNFLKLLVKCKLVISDSGGIQEECSFFKKKVIVCRKITERPESVGKTSVLCPEPKLLIEMFKENIDKDISNSVCPYGDGTSSQKIVDIFERSI